MSRRTVFILLVVGMLLSLTVQNAPKPAESIKANQSLENSSPVFMYDNVTTHEGDLIINGTQTLAIENCTYIQKGNVFVSGSARVTIRNAMFRIDPQDYWHQFEFNVNDAASFEVSNSTVEVPKGACLRCGGNSRVNITQSLLQGMPLVASGSSTITVNDSDYESGMALWEDFKMTILNSTIGAITLNLGPPFSHRIAGLRPGYFDYLNLRQNQSEVDVGWQLTMANSSVGNWGIDLERSYVNVAVSDSALGSVWITYFGTTGQIDGVKDGTYYEHLDINNLELTNTSVAAFSFAIRGSSVEVRNTTALLHLFEGVSNASIYDSDLVFVSRGDGTRAVGVLLLDDSSLSVGGLAYSDLYIDGNITHIEWTGTDWFRSNVTRNYNVIAKEMDGSSIENVTLTLFDKNSALVWNGITDSMGKTDFNVTFSDGNYTDTLRLEAAKGNLSATKSISFLSNTPVAVVLGLHDIAMMNVAPAKTVVGQGHNLDTNFTVTNFGDLAETLYATIYANATNIGTYTVYNLANGTSTTLAFACSTAGLAYGNYTISANTQPVPGENITANNNHTYSVPVHVGVPGDVSGPTSGVYDGTVNMRDISYLIIRFNTKPNSANWNPNADINNDATVNMRDISIGILNFNKHE